MIHRIKSSMEVLPLIFLTCLSSMWSWIILQNAGGEPYQPQGQWGRACLTQDVPFWQSQGSHRVLILSHGFSQPCCHPWECWWARTKADLYLGFTLAVHWDLQMALAFSPGIHTIMSETGKWVLSPVCSPSQPPDSTSIITAHKLEAPF